MTKVERTSRGFGLIRFKDEDGDECSIQESSVGGCLWLGKRKLTVNVGYPWTELSEDMIRAKFGGIEVVGNQRMHLNRKQAKKLIEVLQRYVDTGTIDK